MFVETVVREKIVVLSIVADFAVILPLTSWNLLDFRLVEKEKLLEQHCSLSRGDHD